MVLDMFAYLRLPPRGGVNVLVVGEALHANFLKKIFLAVRTVSILMSAIGQMELAIVFLHRICV